MANGEVTKLTRTLMEAKLLDAQGATTDGVWIPVDGFDKFNVHIKGISDATVIINASNNPTKPANATHDIQLDSATADKMVIVDAPMRWIKARVSAWIGGTISVYLEAVRR